VLVPVIFLCRFPIDRSQLQSIRLKPEIQFLPKTRHVSMTMISCLTLFKVIIVVYSENHMKSLNTLCGQNAKLLIIKAGGRYSYHWALKGWKSSGEEII
jgi:hypothetical protein